MFDYIASDKLTHDEKPDIKQLLTTIKDALKDRGMITKYGVTYVDLSKKGKEKEYGFPNATLKDIKLVLKQLKSKK